MITKQSAFLQNRATILEFLYRNPATSRTDIVNETGLTPATTTNIIKELSEQSLIYETGDEFSEFSGSGRRRKTISITDNIPYVVGGIEINVLGIFLSLCDLQGKTLFETEILNEDYPISEINSTITNMIKTAIEYVLWKQNYLDLAYQYLDIITKTPEVSLQTTPYGNLLIY